MNENNEQNGPLTKDDFGAVLIQKTVLKWVGNTLYFLRTKKKLIVELKACSISAEFFRIHLSPLRHFYDVKFSARAQIQFLKYFWIIYSGEMILRIFF